MNAYTNEEMNARFQLPAEPTMEMAGMEAFLEVARESVDGLDPDGVRSSRSQRAWALYGDHFVRVGDWIVQFGEDRAVLCTLSTMQHRAGRALYGVMYMGGRPVLPVGSAYLYADPDYPDRLVADLKSKL